MSLPAPPPPNHSLHMQPMVLLCLLDVARGLEYLHSCSIVHGGKSGLRQEATVDVAQCLQVAV